MSVHLDAAMLLERLAQDAPVIDQRLRIRLAKVIQQPRRALDVGEQEGDGASRELAHLLIIRQGDSGFKLLLGFRHVPLWWPGPPGELRPCGGRRRAGNRPDFWASR